MVLLVVTKYQGLTIKRWWPPGTNSPKVQERVPSASPAVLMRLRGAEPGLSCLHQGLEGQLTCSQYVTQPVRVRNSPTISQARILKGPDQPQNPVIGSAALGLRAKEKQPWLMSGHTGSIHSVQHQTGTLQLCQVGRSAILRRDARAHTATRSPLRPAQVNDFFEFPRND